MDRQTKVKVTVKKIMRKIDYVSELWNRYISTLEKAQQADFTGIEPSEINFQLWLEYNRKGEVKHVSFYYKLIILIKQEVPGGHILEAFIEYYYKNK